MPRNPEHSEPEIEIREIDETDTSGVHSRPNPLTSDVQQIRRAAPPPPPHEGEPPVSQGNSFPTSPPKEGYLGPDGNLSEELRRLTSGNPPVEDRLTSLEKQVETVISLFQEMDIDVHPVLDFIDEKVTTFNDVYWVDRVGAHAYCLKHIARAVHDYLIDGKRPDGHLGRFLGQTIAQLGIRKSHYPSSNPVIDDRGLDKVRQILTLIGEFEPSEKTKGLYFCSLFLLDEL